VAKSSWHAFYFDSSNNAPPVRTAIIEAEDEGEAGRMAMAQMGRCLRVEIARPVWDPPSRAILARHSLQA
jgi:hypothetical protein